MPRRSSTRRNAALQPVQEKLGELAVYEVKQRRIGYVKYLEHVKVQTKIKQSDTLNATMVNQELASLLKMQELVSQKLKQLDFETKQDMYRISLHDRGGCRRSR